MAYPRAQLLQILFDFLADRFVYDLQLHERMPASVAKALNLGQASIAISSRAIPGRTGLAFDSIEQTAVAPPPIHCFSSGGRRHDRTWTRT
ncbi:hypothetical protein ABL975_00155 [Pseudomonas aeruginosa]|uniref:hypothetical protein n=1 Tax=Pseudomonas TaxID=286 RepID=UPI00068C53C4|nr:MULTISPECIES: hypothetical protein [Pseudomonas]EJB8380821.1 hypothetical protein [Pseudomonas aeruginosa]KRU93548.1 hypothetical protein AN455_18465 [Pseudomonas aeruginosa]KRV00474.1 hypothetical protein AN456_19380 [Pseudomonas aeruginosa]KSJ07466.1 hypothetical protein AO994_22115 [Pseudomonas aeruginosa]MBF8800974.1 hypothetical protein [Pseudomonas aeruginosa]